MAERVYIHELIDIIGHRRAEYMYHMTAIWGPIGQAERSQLCFGVWGTVGSTGRWPQVVNLWEYADWAALGRNFETELTGDGLQDPSLADWWARAAEFRSGGLDRILVAPDWSPSIGDHQRRLAAGSEPAVGYVHETIRCRAGAASEVLDGVRERGIGAHAAAGLGFVAAFRRALADDDECIVIWSCPDWATWSASEADEGGGPAVWRREQRGIVSGRERVLLADAPLSPLRTGRQPDVADRVPPTR